MKKRKYLLLVTFLAFFSCNNEIKKEMPNIIMQTPSVSSSPIIKKQKEIIINETNISSEYLCSKLDLKESELKMYKPYDVVPAKDGSYIYVISFYKKNDRYLFENFTFQNDESKFEKKEKTEISIREPEKIIYKITKDKKISIIKNYDYLGCDLKEIEKNKDKDLLILADDKTYSFNNNLYKIEIELSNIEKKNFGNMEYQTRPDNFFFEDSKIYYSFFSFDNYSHSASSNPESIEEYNFDNELFSYIYSNDGIESLFTKSKFKNYIFDAPFESYSKFSIHKNTNELNSKKSFNLYSKLYSIYEGRPIFDITDLIKDKEEIKKIGKVMIIRKNSKGEVFGLDSIKNIVWKILPKEQKITFFAGSGNVGYKDGKGELAEFNGLAELDLDDLDNLYIADYNNHAIRKITPDGEVSTFYKENY